MKKPVVYIMGVSGSGKTTIGKMLSARTGIPFFDADDFHPEANKEKMRGGQPLNDDDRKEWLARLQRLAISQSSAEGAIIACSALKQRYREVLAAGIDRPVHWIFLQGQYELISQRMKARHDHYMPESLLRSQFDALEVPDNAMVIDIAKDPEAIVREISDRFFNKQ